jgi:uncharacterized protein with HEPN domain
MQKKTETWLFDILSSIEEIEGYFQDKSKNFVKFQKDAKTKRAIERNLEIIGEALNRIVQVNSKVKISDARKIIDTRNRIIHGYDTVSDEILWSIVIKYLPKLKKEVERLL